MTAQEAGATTDRLASTLAELATALQDSGDGHERPAPESLRESLSSAHADARTLLHDLRPR